VSPLANGLARRDTEFRNTAIRPALELKTAAFYGKTTGPAFAPSYGRCSSCHTDSDGRRPTVLTILLVIVLLMLLGAIPTWPHSRSWGYAPSGTLGIVLIVLLILVLTGRV
jgi:hypothetical protein